MESGIRYFRRTPTIVEVLNELSDIFLERIIAKKWSHICALYTGYGDVCTVCFLQAKDDDG